MTKKKQKVEVEFPPVSAAELRAHILQVSANADRALASADRANAAVDRLSEQSAKSDARVNAALDRLSEQSAKSDARVSAALADLAKESSVAIADISKEDKKTRKRIEDAEEARGRAAETWFRESLPGALAEAGYKVDFVEPRRLKCLHHEYDFVAVNGDAVFVGEVKARFRERDIYQLEALAANFRKDFPGKAGDRKVYGIACGLTVDENAAVVARKAGLLVAQAEGKSKVLAKPRKMRGF